MATNPLTELSTLLETQALRIEQLEESMVQRALDFDSLGWTPIAGYAQDDIEGLTLDSLHVLSMKLRELAATNPLHVRGAQLRHSYVFGRGMTFVDLKPAAEKVKDNPYNKTAMFSMQAYETNNLALFTDGNFFAMLNDVTKIFTIIPVKQITGIVTDPDDSSKIRYFKRSWSSNGKFMEEWIPLARYKRSDTLARQIDNGSGQPVPVSKTNVIYHLATKRQSGWVWGVPDSLAAMIWTLAYSGYLSDNTQLVKALSKFAWTITKSSSAGIDKAAAAVATGGVGGTGVMAQGNALASAGVPSAQVNMGNGQPLAAMVATSFGVPVIALLSSPGATGGSYGAATTLDTPTLKGMRAVQDMWATLYEEILRDLGSPKATAQFPSIESDPEYRQIASIGLALADGRLHQDEARAGTLDLLDVQKLHDTMPIPPAVVAADKAAKAATAAAAANPVASQGNTGAVPGGVNQGTTDHNGDTSKATPTK